MKAEAAPTPAKNSSRGMMFTVALVLAVALLEGALLYVAIRWFGGGAGVSYGQGEHALAEAEQPAEAPTAEVALLKNFRVPNNKSGQTIVYDFDITLVVPAENTDRLQQVSDALQSRLGELSDRAAQIVRGASPRILGEDDFHTLRLQLQRAFTEVLRDPDAVQRVLIPRCVPLRAG
jgi:flagellar basal body-associated protein FliL